jgi:hypothetical protein
VIVVDANILIYAFDSTSPFQERAQAWLESALDGGEELGFPLSSLLAFVRIGSDPRVFIEPMSVEDAIEEVTAWLARPRARLVQPTSQHWMTLAAVATAGKVRGAQITDAHIAALALEHGATLCTTDRGFRRYPGLEVLDPTE